jgi:hypothetical protein
LIAGSSIWHEVITIYAINGKCFEIPVISCNIAHEHRLTFAFGSHQSRSNFQSVFSLKLIYAKGNFDTFSAIVVRLADVQRNGFNDRQNS